MKKLHRCQIHQFWISILLVLISQSSFAVTTIRSGALAATDANFEQVIAEFQASQFLSQATFGPTVVEAEALAQRILAIGHRPALEEWINNQFALPVTSHNALERQMLSDDGINIFNADNENQINIYGVNEYRYHSWWHASLTASDQLRQRMAWALSQIFVVNDEDSNLNDSELDSNGQPLYLGSTDYYDLMVDNAFGDYPTLLREVTLHPVMGRFLSHVNNPKPNPGANLFPDENYAREIMQLFSIGLHELNIDGTFLTDVNGNLIDTYNNDTIRTMARVFTGWHFGGQTFGDNDVVFSLPMQADNSEHDTDEKDLTDLRNGVVLPAGRSAVQDLDSVLNMLSTHPNTAPFMARRLIQRFTMSNPSPAYVQEVATTFVNTSGDFSEVLKAVLLADENLNNYTFRVRRNSRSQRVIGVELFNGGSERTRVIEPVLRFTSFLRLFEASSNYTQNRLALPDLSDDFKQGPHRSPTVFNFYKPDYQAPGDVTNYTPDPADVVNGALVSPEFQIMDTTSIVDVADTYRLYIREADDEGVYYRLENDPRRELDVLVHFDYWQNLLISVGTREFFDRLNVYMCGGNVNFNFLRELFSITREEARNAGTRAKDITEGTILSLVEAPECVVR